MIFDNLHTGGFLFNDVSVSDFVPLENYLFIYIILVQFSYLPNVTCFWQTNFPEYQGPEKIVIRRYSDFVWLRDRLSEKYKGIFIPPLPEKSTVGNEFTAFSSQLPVNYAGVSDMIKLKRNGERVQEKLNDLT